MGRLSRQVKIPQSNLAKNAREFKGMPGRIGEGSGTDENPWKQCTNLYELTISRLGFNGHVNPF
jgi:hypothetical protein